MFTPHAAIASLLAEESISTPVHVEFPGAIELAFQAQRAEEEDTAEDQVSTLTKLKI